MSALDDIAAHLKLLQPVKYRWERVILVGVSARESIRVMVKTEQAPAEVEERLGGYAVMDTTEFKGWAVRDIDPAGRWHDAPVREGVTT